MTKLQIADALENVSAAYEFGDKIVEGVEPLHLFDHRVQLEVFGETRPGTRNELLEPLVGGITFRKRVVRADEVSPEDTRHNRPSQMPMKLSMKRHAGAYHRTPI
jgi:hypothetical protein